MRTQVVIIGSGPSGLLLGQLLAREGVETVILDRVSKEYILGRVRAGVLEEGTVQLMEKVGADKRLRREGLPHDGFSLTFDGRDHRIDLFDLTGGSHVMVYGQTEVTHDLMDVREASALVTIYDASDVEPHDFNGASPYVTYQKDGVTHRIDCDFIAGCDGFHGVSRKSVPQGAIKEFEKVYPFGWLGILADVPPSTTNSSTPTIRVVLRSVPCGRTRAAVITSNARWTTGRRTGATSASGTKSVVVFRKTMRTPW